MRYTIFLILFSVNLFGHYLIKDYIAENHIDFKEIAYKEYETKQLKEFTIKFKINLKELQNKINYLTIVSDQNSLIYTNAKYEIINAKIILKSKK